ncbi:MAG TPA: hypothetical protein VHZ98_08020, partial [Galbitalea sp.]|nr:hypothetical protein [Galbitalea sp.]
FGDRDLDQDIRDAPGDPEDEKQNQSTASHSPILSAAADLRVPSTSREDPRVVAAPAVTMRL